MAEVTIVYWRDIPAQVIVGKGRRGVKRPLPERFEQAIDRCAMKVGARETDAYLAEWRKADPVTGEGEARRRAKNWLKDFELSGDSYQPRFRPKSGSSCASCSISAFQDSG